MMKPSLGPPRKNQAIFRANAWPRQLADAKILIAEQSADFAKFLNDLRFGSALCEFVDRVERDLLNGLHAHTLP
jgi:hypothetical protein